MKKTIALVSSAVALTLTLGSFNVSAKAGLVKRLGGQDRYGTSSAIVGFGWEKGQTDYAIIASGEGFADALSAAPLAKKHNAPIILTEGKSLNSKAKAQLERLGVKNVIIVGGNGSISANTEKQIKDLGISIKRIYGQDRYETSLAVAKELGIEKGIVVTNGTGFADSLSMASIAANKGMAIILTKASNLPKNTEEFLKTNEYSKSYVLGGPVIVSENIQKGLKNSKRLYGQDRYDTNAAILKEFVSEIDLSNLYIASGVNYPDALSASALAAKNNGPIMLVDNKLRLSITPFVKGNYGKFENVFPLGGEGVLTNDIVNKIVEGNTLVSFKDKNLENLVRNTIKKFKGDLYRKDVEKITTLVDNKIDNSKKITDISGIENLVNLKSLKLTGNEITDISPLKDLSNLTSLKIGINKINNISSLKALTNLQELELLHNEISDISILKGLTKLTYINLSFNKVSDISVLKNLPNLEVIELDNNEISDITTLKDLKKVKSLALSNNKISDISALQGLKTIKFLQLGHNEISDISALKDLTSMVNLGLEYNKISDISVLSNFSDLVALFLNNNNISDASPIIDFKKLESLNISDNDIKDIDKLKEAMKYVKDKQF